MVRPSLAALFVWIGALASCSADPRSKEEPAAHSPETRGSSQIDLNGRWRILSVDGQPPAGPAQGKRRPSLVFGDYDFGGTVGCNRFGGLGLLADQHFAIHSWDSDAMACLDETGKQEQAISTLFFARPAVRSLGANRVRFESQDHALEIERTGPNGSPPVPAGPEDLTGTSWRIVMMDGQEASTSPTGRILRFGSGVWRGLASCATLSGTWRREGDRIIVGREMATTEQKCPQRYAAIDESFVNLMRSRPRYVVGPNGELLIAGNGHSLTGGRLH